VYGKALVGLGSVIALLGGMAGVEDRYAKARELKLVSVRLDQKILSDRISQLQIRLWQLESKYGPRCHKADQPVINECQQLQQEIDQLKLDHAKK